MAEIRCTVKCLEPMDFSQMSNKDLAFNILFHTYIKVFFGGNMMKTFMCTGVTKHYIYPEGCIFYSKENLLFVGGFK
jgi:hypothetical protein